MSDLTGEIEELHRRMDAAAEALDFEEARRLRDRLTLIRGGATADEARDSDTSGLIRQKPGNMGLGTSQQRMKPPEGWKPPPKPDLHTNSSRRRRHGG